MSRPIIHHRSSDFREILQRTFERLGVVYRTDGDVLLYTSSGTGGMESAISNLTRPGDRVVVVSAGHFGERWAAMAGNFGCEVDPIDYEWGDSPSADDLAARLAETGGAKVVFLTHSETSTGVVADVQSLAAAAKEAGALVVVDAVSSLGAVPLETDSWGLDAVVSGSQKALMTTPGPPSRKTRLAGTTSTGTRPGSARSSSTRRSHRRSRSWSASTSRWGCSSRRAWSRRSSATPAWAAPAGPASAPWASSSFRRTTTARRS